MVHRSSLKTLLSPAFLIPLGLYAMGVWGVGIYTFLRSGGQWIYIGDAAAHMVMARNFVDHGVWGLTPERFSSSSSSPLYTFLVALGFFLVRQEAWRLWIPLLFNFLGGALFLHLSIRLLHLASRPVWNSLLALALVFYVPLPLISLLGMEFTLAIATATLLLWTVLARHPAFRLILPLAPLVRYEFLFLVLGLAAIRWIHREFREGLEILFLGGLGVGMYGLISVVHGGTFFPLTLTHRSNLPPDVYLWLPRFFQNFRTNLLNGMEVTGLLALGWWGLSRGGKREFWQGWLLVTSLGTALHFALARTGNYLSYEAYAVGLSMLGLAGVALSTPPSAVQKLLLAGFFVIPLPRMMGVLQLPSLAWGSFRTVYLPLLWGEEGMEQSVRLATDSPTFAWWMGVRVSDLYGLSHARLSRMWRHGQVDSLVEHARQEGACIAVTRERVFRAALERQGTLVGTWVVEHSAVDPEGIVWFYCLCDSVCEEARAGWIRLSSRYRDLGITPVEGTSGGTR